MIRRSLFLSAIAVPVLLSGCGDNGDSASPTPTPTTSPTPTPTASPTYTAFPLSAATQFTAISAGTSYTGDPATGAVTLGPATTETRTGRVTLAVNNNITSGEYVIAEASEETRFNNAELTVQPATTVPEYVFRETGTGGKFSQIEFLNNSIPDRVSSNETIKALTRVSYANWWRGDTTAGQKRITATVFGYPTVVADVPTTGTAAYTSRVSGRVVSVTGGATAIDRLDGTVTMSVNFSSGLVTLSMNLSRVDAGGVVTPLGTIEGTAGVPVSANLFTGNFGTTSLVPGLFSGGYYGSAAEEIGISFVASGAAAGTEYRIIGTVVGNKN